MTDFLRSQSTTCMAQNGKAEPWMSKHMVTVIHLPMFIRMLARFIRGSELQARSRPSPPPAHRLELELEGMAPNLLSVSKQALLVELYVP